MLYQIRFQAIYEGEDQTLQVGPLAYGTTYYWQIKSKWDYGTTWIQGCPSAPGVIISAGIMSFTTTNMPPPTPIATSVNSNPLNTILSWSSVIGATQYDLQVSLDSTFSDTIFSFSNLLTTSQSISGLSYNSKYWWRVRAKNNTGIESKWSLDFFTTLLGIPVLLSPSNNASNVSLTPNLHWSKETANINSLTYNLQVATNSSFSNIFYQDSTFTDTAILIKNLLNSTQYFWRVRCKSEYSTGGWSNVWSFLTLPTTIIPPDTIPTHINQIYPPNGAINVPINTAISWSSIKNTFVSTQDSTYYALDVDKDSTFACYYIPYSALSCFDSVTTDTFLHWDI